MRLRAFKQFAPFVRYVKDWTEIADVDSTIGEFAVDTGTVQSTALGIVSLGT